MVSVPRRRPRRSRSLAQEGTSSQASQSYHSQVPKDRLSPDRLQRKLWHGGLNPAQLKSEKQVEIRISINAYHTSSLLWTRLCVSFMHPTDIYDGSLCVFGTRSGAGDRGTDEKPKVPDS